LTVQWLSGDELIDEYIVASIPPNSAEMFGFVEVAPTQADFELGRMSIVVDVSSSGWKAFQTFQVSLVRIGISSCSITWDTDEFSHDGSPHGPTVTVKDGDETLVEGVDYELGGDTSTAEAGDYELVITGKGWYEGKSSVDWSIVDNTPPDTTPPTITGVENWGTYTTLPITVTLYDEGGLHDYRLQSLDFDRGEDYRDFTQTATFTITEYHDYMLSVFDSAGNSTTYFFVVEEGPAPYEAEGYAVLEVTPVLSGEGWPGGETLTFTLDGDGGQPDTTSVTLDSARAAEFVITYNEQDIDKTYTYTISEDGFGSNWVVSGDVVATVEVKDNGDGTLDTVVTYSPADATITNTCVWECTLEIEFKFNIGDCHIGDSVPFTVEVSNTSLADITKIKLESASLGWSESIPELKGGESVTLHGAHTVTYADVVAGSLVPGCQCTASNSAGLGVSIYIFESEADVYPTPAVISLDLGGGTLDGQTGTITLDVNVGQTIQLPAAAPTLAGHTFVYWQGSEYYPGDEYVVDGDHTLTAVYEKNAPTIPDTGDGMLTWAYALGGVALVALIVLLIAFFRRRRD
ncbi:MAG: LPXTG cell wall anchor domain-containing protein, partial [Eggerthellaceae bacterium]|nr:LPXTG cell wall anchor domain-containing protein [Eggerthellaceae bacterium]